MCFPTQGGENRRILLDLKTVLEDVQGEVKKEEEKRSELQLQYTTDRCAWELEKAELQSRIAQVAVRKHHLDACLCMRACVCVSVRACPRAPVCSFVCPLRNVPLIWRVTDFSPLHCPLHSHITSARMASRVDKSASIGVL